MNRVMETPAAVRKRSRVLFAATSLQPGTGGIQRVARLMAKVLTEEFADTASARFLTLHDTAAPPGIEAPVRPHGGSNWRMARSALLHGGSHLITDACNLGQLHGLPRLRRKPYLTFLHGIEIWEDAKPRWVRSAQAATVPLFNSNYSRARAEKLHGPFLRANVCWLATESDAAPPALPRPPGAADVLMVGRIEERYKGHHDMVSAWPAVVAAIPGATLRIIGKGPGQPYLEDLAAKSGAGGNIVFEGFVSEERLEDLYSRAALFALPSRGEGFGLVYIEAMRHRLPVIASVHDAAQEVVLDGVTGYTVNLDEPGQLAERIIRVLRNPDLAARMGEAGHARWAEHFRYSGFRDRFALILRDFLAR